MFLAVAAEEKGLLGSEYYAANPLYPLGKTVGRAQHRFGGQFGARRGTSAFPATARLGLLDTLVAEAAQQNRTFTPDPQPEAGCFFRSDHFPLAKAGVPAMSFESGNDLVNGGIARGEAIGREYTDKRYHQPERRMVDGMGLHRHGPGRAIAPRRRLGPGQFRRMAELERRQRIPRHPRPERE